MLETPILQAQNAFDPSFEHTIFFSYDGKQILKNQLIITDNRTNIDVYNIIQSGLKLQHIIPANTLQAGSQYLAKIKVFNDSGDESDFSSPIIFYCYSTPDFYFDKLTNDNTINSSNINLSLIYSQSEGEELQQFKYELYQHDKTLLAQSTVFYLSEHLKYTFFGLKTANVYYVQATGKTNHGMSISTGFIKINVEYIMIPANVLFKVNNNYKNGYTTLESGIIDIGYEVDNDNYTISNSEVTLIDNRITYNSGFEITGDFSVFLKARRLPLGGTFFLIPQTYGEITLSIIDVFKDYYCKLLVPSIIHDPYTIYSELPKPLITDKSNFAIADTLGNALMMVDTVYWDEQIVVFELKRKNGLYSLRTYYEQDKPLYL